MAWVCGFSLAGIAGSNPADSTVLSLVSAVGYKVEVSCVCLITRPEEPYLVWCVWVWSWSRDSESLVHWGPSCHEKKNLFITIHNAFVTIYSNSPLSVTTQNQTYIRMNHVSRPRIFTFPPESFCIQGVSLPWPWARKLFRRLQAFCETNVVKSVLPVGGNLSVIPLTSSP